MTPELRIADTTLGQGRRTWVVVELGVTHEGDVAVAEKMVDVAAEAKADAVKVEVIHPDALVADRSIEYTYQTASGTFTVNYHELLQHVALSDSDIARVAARAREKGLAFFGSAFDEDGVRLLRELGSCAIKFSSGELDHYPLLDLAARTGLPVICDTGRATVSEAAEAGRMLAEAGATQISFMHVPTGYPAPAERTDLRMIPALRDATGRVVGLSCHTIGLNAVVAAIALGASIIEKTVSPDPSRSGDEHLMSLPYEGVAELVAAVRWTDAALGSSDRDLTPDERRDRMRFRQSAVAARDLRRGARLTREDVRFARPARGIRPSALKEALGKRLKRDINAGDFVAEDDI